MKTTKLSSIKSNGRNPRKIDSSSLDKLCASITRDPQFMELRPIVVDDDGMILGGNQRFRACKKLGMKEVPASWVRTASGLTDEQRKRFILVDNAPDGMSGEWDLDTLTSEWEEVELKDLGFDLDSMAADLSAGLSTNEELDAEPQTDRAEDLQDEWRTDSGQLWRLGDHVLLCGDSTNADDVKRCLGDIVPELMVTDPPYGVDYDPAWRAKAGVNRNRNKLGRVKNDDQADWTLAWSLFPGDVAYVYHAGIMSSTVQTSLETCGFKVRAQIIWAKDRMALSRGDYHWQHEPIWYAVRDGKVGLRTKDRKQTTLWNIPARDDSGHGHGTQKPVECMARAIRNHLCEYVYEPFSGSGTTIIACEQLGRKCLAIEISPKYVAVALQRYKDATGKQPELVTEERN